MRYASLNIFLRGSLTIELRGEQVQKVLSEFHRHGIDLHRVRMQNGKSVCVIQLSDFQSFYKICRGHNVKIRFLSRDGIPFILRNSQRRKSFSIGIFLFIGLILLFNSMIWKVQIMGMDEDTTADILQSAHSVGIYPGAFKWRLGSVENISRQILMQTPNLMWVGIHIDGSVVTIQSIEKIEGVKEHLLKPQNIIASKPGVMVKIFASRGRILVKPGQFVQPGQVLISGDLFEGQTLVPAEGNSIGEVWYVSKIQVPLHVVKNGLTGAYVVRDYLDWNGFGLRVWGWREPNFGIFVERESKTSWHFNKWLLPIQWKTVTEYQVQKDSGQKSVLEAQGQGLAIALQDVRTQMGSEGTVLQQMVLHEEVSRGTLYETVLTRTQEDIGIAAPIDIKQSETDIVQNSSTG